MYPRIIIDGVPDSHTRDFIILSIIEFVFLCEIFIRFFLQQRNEQGRSQNLELPLVMENYIKTKFLVDIFIFIPFGFIGTKWVH